jgi:uncharacterized membrane protein
MYSSIGKILIGLGVLLVLVGVVLVLFNKFGILGKLPGDIHLRKQNFEFRFPLVTCMVISVVITLLLNLFLRWFRK